MLSGMEQEWEGVFAPSSLSARGEAFPFSQGFTDPEASVSISPNLGSSVGKCAALPGRVGALALLGHLTSIAPWPESF